MHDLVIEVQTFNDLALKKRILYYSYLISKKIDTDFSLQWSELETKFKELKTRDFLAGFEQEAENIEKYIGIEVLEFIGGNEKKDKVDVVSFTSAWRNVKTLVGNGKNWIVELHEYLENLYEKHMKLAKVILSFLVSIFTGMVGNCIYDGIKSVIVDRQLSEIREVGFADEELKNIILIEDEEGYQIIYYDKDGKIVTEYISEEQLTILEKEDLQ